MDKYDELSEATDSLSPAVGSPPPSLAAGSAYPIPIGGIGGGMLDKMASERRHRRATTREQIQERIAGLQAQIEKHQRVLTILDANRGMEEALDALREIGI